MSQIEYLTSKSSYLLLKDDVGKARPPTRALPGKEFTYGKSSGLDADHAKELLSSWKFHNPTQDDLPLRDFRKLNKQSLQLGNHTSKHYSNYRRGKEIRVPVNRGSTAVTYEIPDDEFRFGVPNRPSTPMISVMSNEYGCISELMAKEIYNNRQMNESRRTKFFPKLTNSVHLNSCVTQKKLEELEGVNRKKDLFKMTKFRGIANKVNTINKPYLEMRARAQSVAEPKARSSIKGL
jgi:hypothetical protein